MKKFRNKWDNPIGKRSKGQINNDPSLTVPDMSYTIQEIFEKYVTFPEIGRPGDFDDDDIDFDDIVKSRDLDDLTDIDDAQLSLFQVKQTVKARKKEQESKDEPNA